MSIFDQIRPLVEAGFSIHWLKEQLKAPVEPKWSTVPPKTMAQLEAEYLPNLNVGVRLGEWSKVGSWYLHVVDVDIRDPAKAGEAHDRLKALFPNYEFLPYVISGSGGESRHFYFLADKPFASKKLARSEGFSMVYDPAKGRPVKKHDWEIELFGGTKESCKQVAMPPSVHPDTGAEYEWGRPFPLDLLDLGVGPIIPSAQIEALPGVSEALSGNPDERPPLDLTIEQAKGYLDGLPIDQWCIDRDGWYQVGMALHHEFAGRGLAGEAFELWCEFSGQSDKFDINDARRVWVSFKDNKTRNIRMATIMQAARLARFEEKFSEVIEGQNGFDDSPDVCTEVDEPESVCTGIDDLLGLPSPTAAADPMDDLDDLVEKTKSTEPASAWMSKLITLTMEVFVLICIISA